MDAWQIVRALARRWYLTVPMVVLSVLAATLVRGGVMPGYSVSATVIVLPPSEQRVLTDTGPEVVPVNPLLGFNASTLTAATTLSILANAPAFRNRLDPDAALAAYEVEATPRLPTLQIKVESQDINQALGTAQEVVDNLGEELDAQQLVRDADQLLSVQVLAAPAVDAVDRSQLRAFVATLAAGLLFMIGIVVSIDAAARHRRRGRGRDVRLTAGRAPDSIANEAKIAALNP